MFRRAKAWEGRVRRHFDFLVEHGFRFDRVETSGWSTDALYLSSSLGVEVTSSVEFDRVEVSLLRLAEGKVPEPQVWVTDRPIDRVLLDNVLVARDPGLAEASQSLHGRSRRKVEDQLRFWAERLRSAAPDFLLGEDAAIVEAEQVIRRRVAENPQELTIWLPNDASPEEEERALEEARKSAPPEVSVSTRRYSR